jgi:hypothetical protein
MRGGSLERGDGCRVIAGPSSGLPARSAIARVDMPGVGVDTVMPGVSRLT